MENLSNETETKPQIEERLPWHKPELLQLTVSLDTANGTSSGPDGLKTGYGLFPR